MSIPKTVIIIAGPTAVGKTAAAIQSALHFNTQIISADSRQCYKELSIGVARPSSEELAAAPHHFIATHSIWNAVNAAVFEKYALDKVAEVFKEKDVVVMVGGTGLYLKAFTDGLDVIPEVPQSIRESLIKEFKEKGLAWLQKELFAVDPLFFEGGETANPHRLLRALEVYKATGKPLQTFKKGQQVQRPFRVIKTALHLPKETLHESINNRVEGMFEMGLEHEVRSLIEAKHLPSLQTVGYTELFRHFEGKISLPEAKEQIKIHTRQYAKRQLTWFKKDTGYQWFLSGEQSDLMAHIEKELAKQQ